MGYVELFFLITTSHARRSACQALSSCSSFVQSAELRPYCAQVPREKMLNQQDALTL